nr:transcription factor MYB41-like [Tanacetum cinerariifolium]
MMVVSMFGDDFDVSEQGILFPVSGYGSASFDFQGFLNLLMILWFIKSTTAVVFASMVGQILFVDACLSLCDNAMSSNLISPLWVVNALREAVMSTNGFDGTEIVRVLAGHHITIAAMADHDYVFAAMAGRGFELHLFASFMKGIFWDLDFLICLQEGSTEAEGEIGGGPVSAAEGQSQETIERVEADARMSIDPVLLSPSTNASDCDYFLHASNFEAGESFQRAKNFTQTMKVESDYVVTMQTEPTFTASLSRQTNQTIHMIMPSKDTLYNGRKGIGFENPSYFKKAKDLRPSLYDEKVIGLGYTPMLLIHSDEALEIEKFKRARKNKIEFTYDYGNLSASYVNEKINFSDDYFQEIINPDFEKIDSPFQQTSSLKPYVPSVILEKIIIDLEDEVVSLLEKEKVNLETIESLKSKVFESSENAIFESEIKVKMIAMWLKKSVTKW